MGSDKDELYSSLMKWLRTFPIQQQGTEENICEGVSMAQVIIYLFLAYVTHGVTMGSLKKFQSVYREHIYECLVLLYRKLTL